MVYRMVSTVHQCGHTIVRKESSLAKAAFGIAKRWFSRPPIVHKTSEDVCPTCASKSAKSLSNPAKPRHAPPSLGYEETIEVVALGGASLAVEKLKKMQEGIQDVVAQQRKCLKQPQFMENEVAKQVMAQNDLDQASKFWEDFHQGHARDGLVSTQGDCLRCSEMGEILTNPDYSANDKILSSNTRSSEILQPCGNTSTSSVHVCVGNTKGNMEPNRGEDSEYKGKNEVDIADDTTARCEILPLSDQAEQFQDPEYSQYFPVNVHAWTDDYSIPTPDATLVENHSLRCMRLSQSEPIVEEVSPDNEIWVKEPRTPPNISQARSHKERKRQRLVKRMTGGGSQFFAPARKPDSTVSPYDTTGAILFEKLREYFCLPSTIQPEDMKRFFEKRPLISTATGCYLRTSPEWAIKEYGLKASTDWLILRDKMIMASILVKWPVNKNDEPEPRNCVSRSSSVSYLSDSDEDEKNNGNGEDDEDEDENGDEGPQLTKELESYAKNLTACFPDLDEEEIEEAVLSQAKKRMLPSQVDAVEASKDSSEEQEKGAHEGWADIVCPVPIIPSLPRFLDVPMSYITSVTTRPSIAEEKLSHRPRESSRLRTELIVLEL